MQIETINQLINNPLKPNPAEWAMSVENILKETGNITERTSRAIDLVINQNGAFSQYTDILIAVLKQLNKNNEYNYNIKGENINMTKENIFIIYSHKHSDIMFEIKDFISNDLGFEPKILDINTCTGNVWDAFSEKSQNCQKAIVIMAADDKVIIDNTEYMQARPNVFIELGYMIHKCGLNNVIIIKSKDCKIPSDLEGLIHVVYNSEKWTESLRKQLNR